MNLCNGAKKYVSLVVILLKFSGAPLRAGGDVLFSLKPAANWNEAFPVGNGRLGAMDFGGIDHLRLQLNEGSVWAGQRMDRDNPSGYNGFLEARKLLAEGKPLEAEAAANRDMIGVPNRMPQYQTMGDLIVDFQLRGSVSAYSRALDLGRAVASVRFRVDGGDCTRDLFSSAADQVIVMRIGCDRPGQVSFTATLARAIDSRTESVAADTLRMNGEAVPRDPRHADEPKTGVKFSAVLRAVPEGGTIKSDGNRLTVAGANSAVLLLAARTDFREKDPAAAALSDVSKAHGKSWTALLNAHMADHRLFFSRMSVSLGTGDPALEKLPTHERIRRVGEGANDPGLAALYLKFARYLLIAGSRPGNLPETLQGLWNDSLSPPWDSKYTININTEMNYWPAEEANLSELTAPLFDLIDMARGPGRVTAQRLYHAAGFVIHHNTDIWGDAVPIDQARSGMWPMGGAWLSLHLWDHYDYTQDRKFLADRGYPVMEEAAEFFLDYLADDGQGHLVTGPSVSPENRYKTADGKTASLAMGTYMDTEIVRALFTRVIRASEILNIDADFRARLESARAKLMPFKIGRYGRLQEWAEDYEDAEPGHRHISHLWALYPDNQISPRTTPDLAKAARVTLERRLAHGGGSTGWSRAWIVCYYARLLDGEQAWSNFNLLVGKSTLPDMLNDGPPFQIDGNLGGAAGLIEMMLQSQGGEIAFLPAIPAAWKEGEVKGLRARGALGVDLSWREAKGLIATLRPDTAGTRMLRPPPGMRLAALTAGGRRIAFAAKPDGPVAADLAAGKTYEAVFR